MKDWNSRIFAGKPTAPCIWRKPQDEIVSVTPTLALSTNYLRLASCNTGRALHDSGPDTFQLNTATCSMSVTSFWDLRQWTSGDVHSLKFNRQFFLAECVKL